MVLRYEPPPGAAEAERAAAEASTVVEHGTDHARGYPTTRAVVENQGFEGSRAKG
jgi:hypothetical protein